MRVRDLQKSALWKVRNWWEHTRTEILHSHRFYGINQYGLYIYHHNFKSLTCVYVNLKLRHNSAKSIAGSPCGDRGLESCKNPAAIRRFGTHPGLIRRWSGKFNSQLKFAGWSADSSPLFLIWRRPVGHRPIIERRSGGHRPKCSGKNPQVIERRSGNRRPMTARCHQGYRTEIRRCL